MKRSFLTIGMATLLAMGTLFAQGVQETAPVSDFPTKTITINMSWKPGGSSDTQCKLFVENAQDVFGQPVVVMDKSGATGTKSCMATKMAKPDGYTDMWASGGQFTITPLQIPVEYSIKDFKPICGVTMEPSFVVTGPNSGIQTLDDLKNIDTISYGTCGAGSGPAVALKMLMDKMGVDAEMVPFAGSNEGSVAALGGHVTIADSRAPIIDSMPNLNVLCTLSTKRLADYPDIPTAKELGYDVVLESYNGLYVPKDTPDAIVQKLSDGFAKLKSDPKFVDFCKNSKIVISDLDSTGLQNKVDSDIANFSNYVSE